MKILKIPGKIILTVLYPALYPLVVKPMNKMACGMKPVGFAQGLQYLWQDNPKEKE